MVISIDPGKDGGVATEHGAISMPTIKIETKPALYQFALKDGKKQVIQSGPNKGEFKKKLRSPAKYTTELDVQELFDIFHGDYRDGSYPNTLVIELPGNTRGNAAKATATTFLNFGKILALAELADCKIVKVPANKWKKDLSLPKDKLPCVELAEKLSGKSFRTERGKLLDGPAESF